MFDNGSGMSAFVRRELAIGDGIGGGAGVSEKALFIAIIFVAKQNESSSKHSSRP
jgi:uncharacterized spore protein YtfJ